MGLKNGLKEPFGAVFCLPVAAIPKKLPIRIGRPKAKIVTTSATLCLVPIENRGLSCHEIAK